MNSFIRSAFLFAFLLFTTLAADYELKYPHGKRVSDPFHPQDKYVEPELKAFKELANQTLHPKDAQNLHRWIDKSLFRGTCIGQCYTFLMLNPPETKTLILPSTPWAQKMVVWFQAKEFTRYFYVNSYWALEKKGIELVRRKDPNLSKTDEQIGEQLSKYLSKLEQHPEFEKECHQLLQKYKLLGQVYDFTCKLDRQESKILANKGVKSLRPIRKEKKSCPEDFKTASQRILMRFMRNPSITDAVICFNLIVERKVSGHAILVQFKHLRIYDPARGIFEYETEEDLIKDLPISKHHGCSFFFIQPFKRTVL